MKHHEQHRGSTFSQFGGSILGRFFKNKRGRLKDALRIPTAPSKYLLKCLGWVQRVQIPSEEVLGALGLQFLLSSFLYSFRESLPHHIPVEVGRSVGRPPKVCNEIGEQLQRGQAAIYKRRKYKSGL